MNADQRKGQLDCLLADFAVIKSEISRRSNLQRVVVAAYLAVLAWCAREFLAGPANSAWIPVLWVTCVVALQYCIREGLEIGRLSSIIREKIAPAAAALLEAGDAHLFPSETDPEATNTSHMRRRYDRQFFWIAFFATPLAASAWFLMNKCQQKDWLLAIRTRHLWLACLSLVAATFALVRLLQWFWLNRQPANKPLQPTAARARESRRG